MSEKENSPVAVQVVVVVPMVDLNLTDDGNGNCGLMDCSCNDNTDTDDGHARDHQLKLVYEQEDRLSSYSMLLSSTSESVTPSQPQPTEPALLFSLKSPARENFTLHKGKSSRLPIAISSQISETPRSAHSTLKPEIKPRVLFPRNESKAKVSEWDRPAPFRNVRKYNSVKAVANNNSNKQKEVPIPVQIHPTACDVDNYVRCNFKDINDDYFVDAQLEPLFPEIENDWDWDNSYNSDHSDVFPFSQSIPSLASHSSVPIQYQKNVDHSPFESQQFIDLQPLSPGFINQVVEVGDEIGNLFQGKQDSEFSQTDCGNGQNSFNKSVSEMIDFDFTSTKQQCTSIIDAMTSKCDKLQLQFSLSPDSDEEAFSAYELELSESESFTRNLDMGSLHDIFEIECEASAKKAVDCYCNTYQDHENHPVDSLYSKLKFHQIKPREQLQSEVQPKQNPFSLSNLSSNGISDFGKDNGKWKWTISSDRAGYE